MTATAAFLLAFPALFAIVNPLGMAFIVGDLIADLPHPERTRTVRLIALYSLGMMLGALWLGSYIFAFFGVSIEALRVAGGIVVILSSLELLLQPDRREARKTDQATASASARGGMGSGSDRAFFPLTMPLTTGPGTIAIAVTLGATRPEGVSARLLFGIGISAAAIAMAALVWLTYWSAERLGRYISPAGQRIVSRLSAFLLLSIGVQIMIGGVGGVVADFAASARGR